MPPIQELPEPEPTTKGRTKSKPKTGRPNDEPTRQIEIVHLSDLHFGKYHRFNPKVGPDGKPLKGTSKISLADKLADDLATPVDNRYGGTVSGGKAPPPATPVLLCITGDFAEEGAYHEFDQAHEFLRQALARFPGVAGTNSIFMVAGNHDVPYEQQDIGARWQQYVNFYNRFYGTKVSNADPWSTDAVHDRIDDLGAVVACINSSIYVCKDSPDEQRGQVDDDQLHALEAGLKKIGRKRLDSAIRIALIHHHPVLIPSLVEPNRNYDAVIESGRLITILKRYGFHLLLHGHKHHPHVFTEDVRNAFVKSGDGRMLVAAGGSVGSSGYPQPGGANCYNRIIVKWHAAAGQARMKIVTRRLVTHDPRSNDELHRKDWSWDTLWQDDLSFTRNGSIEQPDPKAEIHAPFDAAVHAARESLRKSEYQKTWRNMAVADVRPSLWPGQAYEVTVWLVAHRPESPGWKSPKSVTWSAGGAFQNVVTIHRGIDPRFCTSFDYWGPVLLQAEMTFDDGTVAYSYIYARLPGGN